jgi:regulator of replication initiation timing
MTDLFTLLWLALALFCALLIQSHEDCIANQRRLLDHMVLRLAEAEDGREQVQQQLDMQNERVGAYLKEATILSLDNERLKARCGDDFDAGEIISEVESWLA